MDLKFSKYEKRGHVAYITINRPEVYNAVHPPCSHEMVDIWDDFAADNNLWIAVVTGAGEKAFSAGNDLKFTAENSIKGMKPARGGFAGITRRFDINKPLIAAVNGFALGRRLRDCAGLRHHHRRRPRPLRSARAQSGTDGDGGRGASSAASDPAQDRDGHDADGQTYHRPGSRQPMASSTRWSRSRICSRPSSAGRRRSWNARRWRCRRPRSRR